jgi:hypothetical protein
MRYKGRYQIFNNARIRTYPVKGRTNKVKLDDMADVNQVIQQKIDLPETEVEKISMLAEEIIKSRRKGNPVMLFTGGHLVKNGLGPIIIDLVGRNILTMISGNGSVSIHDFELALMGETSEFVPHALEKGQFGMAFEMNYINAALIVGNNREMGYGESIGKLIRDAAFRKEVAKVLDIDHTAIHFKHPEISIAAACFKENIPFTVHAGIGTDVIDQHFWFDGSAKGGCSGRDFLIFTHESSKLVNGGVFLNVGSAVTGPEVFLKAASMIGNTGDVPANIIAADFDIRPYKPESMDDESSPGYYFRDQKSIVTRIPRAYAGKGFYIEGNQLLTIPLLYQEIMRNLSG